MIETMIYRLFMRHADGMHGADYEACPDWLCRFGWWVERVSRFHERYG